MSNKQAKTTILISAGTFFITSTKSTAMCKGRLMDYIHVSDGSDWVEAEFLYPDKPRLSVQELAWGFRAILKQAHDARMGFAEYFQTLMPNADRLHAQLKYDHDKWLLTKLSYMDINLDSIPSLIDEITSKYELGRGRGKRDVKIRYTASVLPSLDLLKFLERTDNHE